MTGRPPQDLDPRIKPSLPFFEAATEAARQRLVALRADGTIGDAAFQRIEQELDWTEFRWAQFLGSAEGEG